MGQGSINSAFKGQFIYWENLVFLGINGQSDGKIIVAQWYAVRMMQWRKNYTCFEIAIIIIQSCRHGCHLSFRSQKKYVVIIKSTGIIQWAVFIHTAPGMNLFPDPELKIVSTISGVKFAHVQPEFLGIL